MIDYINTTVNVCQLFLRNNKKSRDETVPAQPDDKVISLAEVDTRQDIFRSFLRRRTKVRQRKRTKKGNNGGHFLPAVRIICTFVVQR